jgi:hypothetical protein
VPRDNLGPFAEIMGATATRVHLGMVEPVEGVRILTRALERGSLHLLVNDRDEGVQLRLLVSSDEPLRIETWDPADGLRTTVAEHVETTDATRLSLSLAPHESIFLVAVPPQALEAAEGTAADLPAGRVIGTFGLPEPVQGREVREGDVVGMELLPAIPADTPATEEGRWDLIPGCERFSGTMEYRLAFDAPEDWARRRSAIALADVRYVAEGELNGQPLGALIWAPYRWDTTGLLRTGRNELVVQITNTLANAALSPEVMEEAKARGWWNVYRERSQPMMEESVASGVSPVVRLCLGNEEG